MAASVATAHRLQEQVFVPRGKHSPPECHRSASGCKDEHAAFIRLQLAPCSMREHSEAEHSQIVFSPPRRRPHASGHDQCRKGRKEAEQDDLYTHGSSENAAEQSFKAVRCVCPSCAHHGRAKHHRQIEPDCRRHRLRFCTFSFVETISLRLQK